MRFATTAIVPYNFSSLESSALTSRSSKKGELAQETLRVRKGTHFIPSENNCQNHKKEILNAMFSSMKNNSAIV